METLTVQGVEVPKLGLGTWQLTGRECREAVETALDLGYRHVDTAQLYENERSVGAAIAGAAIDREDVFLTTKVAPGNYDYPSLLRSVQGSLEKLDTAYVDLLLLHWPSLTVDIEETMRAMDELVDLGKVEHVGVSNFSVRRLKQAREAADNPVLTDQVQFHPYHPQRKLLRYCQDNDLMLTAYSPLGHRSVLDDEVLADLGRRYDKTPAQVALRWATQHRNVAAIPKATSREHLAENADVFDFKLSREELERATQPSLLKTGASQFRGMVDATRQAVTE